MPLAVTTIMLGVEDLARAKKFYSEGMGGEVVQDYPHFVLITMGEGSSLALYQREGAAQDAGVSSEGSGYRAVSFHHIVTSQEAVDEIINQAVAAGASVVKAAAATKWGYFGYFADPDGFLWKVAAANY